MPEFVFSPTIVLIPLLICLVVIELGVSRLLGRSVYTFQDSITFDQHRDNESVR